MMRMYCTLFACLLNLILLAQTETNKESKNRLDFAKTYFELGGTFLPSFTGKQLQEGQVASFQHPVSAIQYLNWGGFHFWGHAEFYVTMPLSYQSLTAGEPTKGELLHSVATGARFFPWAYRQKRIRPYVGVSWSALDFQQKLEDDVEYPALAKDLMLGYDAGFLFGYRSLSLRVGMSYFPNNTWDYPLSKNVKAEIETPNFGFQLGLMYAMDFSKRDTPENIERWNSYPRLSAQSLDATSFGSFFLAAGPTISYSLKASNHNREMLPYLKEQLTSANFFDIALGYHFERWGAFAALSFRNPRFETTGFGDRQTIQKTSLALELNKYLLDYSGFTPYVGLNLAYDQLKYEDEIDGVQRSFTALEKFNPGITIGWDIQPKKNAEALILRTNLRWYPSSSFTLDGKKFDFSQLEYNLIQLVFYPGRSKRLKQ
ncbi:MAG: hypothetical protein AAF361_10480 [Bacteroidota bacterium]